jgi:hypothetical protein
MIQGSEQEALAMTTTTQEFNAHSTWIIVSAVAVTAAVGFVCSQVSMPEYLTAAVSGGAALIPGSIAYSRWKAARGATADLRALGRGRLERPVAIVITLTAVVLLLVESVIGFLFGTAVDLAVGMIGATPEEAWLAAAVVTLFLAAPAFVASSFFIARRAAHYVWPTPFRWLALAVAGYLVMRIVVSFAYIYGTGVAAQFDLVASMLGLIAVALLVLLTTWLGCLAARRSHSRFVAGRLFQKLPPDEQATVLSLLGDVVDPRPAIASDDVRGEPTGEDRTH